MKKRITVTVSTNLLQWVDKEIGELVFANRSHCFEFLINQEMKKDKK
ncbi:MAG: hypothetical protein AABX32_04475 [Nanoarchaeota archaeon]